MTDDLKQHLTAGELETLRLAEAATAGPWELDKNYQCYIWGPQMQMVADDGGGEDGHLIRMRGVGANLPLAQNGSFIADARTAIPALLETVAGLRAKLAEAKNDTERLNWCIKHGAIPDCYFLGHGKWSVRLGDEYGDLYVAVQGETPRAAIDAARGQE